MRNKFLLLVIILILIAGFAPLHAKPAKAEEVLLTHPRLLFTSKDISELRALKDSPSHQAIYNNIKSWADDHIADPAPAEHTNGGQTQYLKTMGFMYHMTDDVAYAAAAKTWLLSLAGWSSWECANGTWWQQVTDMALASAIGYDMLYDYLTTGERTTVSNAMIARINADVINNENYVNYSDSTFAQPYPNNIFAAASSVGMAALALKDDWPGADDWLDFALFNANRALSLWQKYGFYEGPGYNDYCFSTITPFLDALERVTGEDLFDTYPILTQVPDYFLYLIHSDRNARVEDTGWGTEFTGDSNELRNLTYLYKFATKYNNSYAQWFADTYSSVDTFADHSYLVEAFVWKSSTLSATAPTALPLHKYFPELGYVVFKEGWTSGDRFLLFKSGTSQGHAHSSQNEWQIYLNGKPISCGPGYVTGDSSRDKTWTHNCILVDGLGQAQEPGDDESCPLDTRGIIEEFADNSPYYGYVRADASAPYIGEASFGDLDSWKRQIVYMNPSYFVMYDEVEATGNKQFDWLVQMPNTTNETLGPDTDSFPNGGPTVVGNTITMTKTGGSYVNTSVKYIIKVLEPASFHSVITPVDMDYGGDDYYYVSVHPATNVSSTRFLTVHFPLESGGSALTTAEVHTDNMMGVKVTDGSNVDLILFSEDGLAVDENIDLGDHFHTVGCGGDGTFTITNHVVNAKYSQYMVIRLTAGAANSAPILNSIGDKTINEGTKLEFVITGFDPDGGTLTYSASNLPSGASFDPITKTFSWTPISGQAGTYSIHFEVSDGEFSDSEDIGIQVVAEYLSTSFTPPTDPDGYTFIRDWTYINASVDSVYDTSSFIDWNKSLVAYWNFNENSGSIANDSSTYNNDGLLHGPQRTTGKFGSALQFDGVDDYVEVVGSGSLDITNEITVEAWVKMPENMGNGTLWVKKSAGNVQSIFARTSDQAIFFIQDLNSSSVSHYVNSVFSPNIWHHVACTYDGSYMRIYVDGMPCGLWAETGQIDSGDNFYIGMQNFEGSNMYPFNGLIDEVKIWKRALSPGEIKASYNSEMFSLSNEFTDLANGSYEYYIYTTDITGDSVQTETRTITIDSTILLGDANGDSLVNTADITMVERIIFELDSRTPGADTNQNAVINTADITLLERIIAGLP